LVIGRPSSGRPQIDYATAVQEALCFGWVDGQAGSVDERFVLSSIALAKRPETRTRRIEKAADAAERNERPDR
jgi:uncharacterized protein YdeI (YjbR/CyaY-like superfamily)